MQALAVAWCSRVKKGWTILLNNNTQNLHPEADTLSDKQEDTRFRVLRLLQENPEISQRQIADALGIKSFAIIIGLKDELTISEE